MNSVAKRVHRMRSQWLSALGFGAFLLADSVIPARAIEVLPADAEKELADHKALAQRFVESLLANKFEAAFAQLDAADVRVVSSREGDEAGKLLVRKKMALFVRNARAVSPLIQAALPLDRHYRAIRHDSSNVSVWVPLDSDAGFHGELVFRLVELGDGSLKISNFCLESGFPYAGSRGEVRFNR